MADTGQKKSKSLLIRVEPDVKEHYEARARKKRTDVAEIVRQVLYADMAAHEASSKENGNGNV